MKKKLLFVIDSLDIGGAEKSLISLLNLLDYQKFSVDLMLFSHGKLLEQFLPKEVNVLPQLKFTQYSNEKLNNAVIYSFKSKNSALLLSRIKYSTKIRLKKYNNPEKARIYWETTSMVLENNNKFYDVAISYAQGVPTFYVAEKVKARRKVAWVNANYRLNRKNKKYQTKFYERIDEIIAVSENARDVLAETFPEFEKKMKVIYDINNASLIQSMAQKGSGFGETSRDLRILTIGRLSYQKGYDIALQACEKLMKQGVNFKWYVLGKGPLLKFVEREIIKRGLANHFILLGVKSNPYPYIKNSDIYVQTSRFEGFGLAIAEARMLNIPVVTTRFDAVYNQMIHERNGLVVDMDGHSIFEGIMKLVNNPSLKEQIVKNLKEEKKGNTEELEKFYELIS